MLSHVGCGNRVTPAQFDTNMMITCSRGLYVEEVRDNIN